MDYVDVPLKKSDSCLPSFKRMFGNRLLRSAWQLTGGDDEDDEGLVVCDNLHLR